MRLVDIYRVVNSLPLDRCECVVWFGSSVLLMDGVSSDVDLLVVSSDFQWWNKYKGSVRNLDVIVLSGFEFRGFLSEQSELAFHMRDWGRVLKGKVEWSLLSEKVPFEVCDTKLLKVMNLYGAIDSRRGLVAWSTVAIYLVRLVEDLCRLEIMYAGYSVPPRPLLFSVWLRLEHRLYLDQWAGVFGFFDINLSDDSVSFVLSRAV